MSTGHNATEGTHLDENSPQAVKRRKRFWRLWVIVNLLVIFVAAPGVYMLITDAIVQIADGSEYNRVQAAIGVYLLGAGATFCTLFPVNAVALVFGLMAKSGRERRRQESTAGNQYSHRQYE